MNAPVHPEPHDQPRIESRAVDELQALSTALIEAARSEDTESIPGLLDARAAACAELARLIEGGLRLEESDLRRLLELQAECEEAIRAAVEDTASRLREIAAQRRVRCAYVSRDGDSIPRYLDRKQ